LTEKKKGKEVEELLIRLGVKIILLSKNKDLTLEDLARHRTALKGLCDLMSHHSQFSFEYSHVLLQNQMNLLVNDMTKTLSRCLSPKNIARVTELHTYLSSAPILDTLFIDPNMRSLKKDWHYLMKNLSTQIETTMSN